MKNFFLFQILILLCYKADQQLNKSMQQVEKLKEDGQIEYLQYFDNRKSFFYGLKDIQAIIEKQKKGDELIDKAIKCDPDVLSLFSITGPQILQARKNDNIREQYCDSQYVCCSGDHIKQIIPRLAEGIHRLRRKYQPYFNLITLFKSKHIRNFLQQSSKYPKCTQILKDQEEILSEDEIAFFKIPSGRETENVSNENFENLYAHADLTDFENFKKFMRRIDVIQKDINFFLDQTELKAKAAVCNMCDAFQQKNLEVNLENEKSPVLTVSSEMCLEIYWQQRLFFEFNLINRVFFTRLTEFFLCAENKLWSFATTREVYQMETKRPVPKKKCSIQLSNKKLFDPNNEEDKKCLEFCEPLFSLNEPFLQNKTIAAIKRNVAVVYELFNKQSLPKLYKEDFNKDYYIGMETQRIIFFPLISIFGQKTSIRALEFKFDLYHGYSDEFSLPLQQFDEEIDEELENLKYAKSGLFQTFNFLICLLVILI